MAYHRQQGVDTAIVRIFNTHGPKMRAHDGRAIPTFLRQALANRPLTVFGDGSQTRSFCYVSDLIRGLIALAESGYHDPVNIGNPDEFTPLPRCQENIHYSDCSIERAQNGRHFETQLGANSQRQTMRKGFQFVPRPAQPQRARQADAAVARDGGRGPKVQALNAGSGTRRQSLHLLGV